LPDAYDRILKELSKRLPSQDDIDLLKTLTTLLKTEGRDAAEAELKKMIKNLGETIY
jgi:hypothetical protein